MEFIAHVFHIYEYLLIFFSLAVRIGCKSHKVKCESFCGWSPIGLVLSVRLYWPNQE